MVTQDDLRRWSAAKNLSVTSLSIDPEISIALQEMYIELKQLRRDNLKLLNTDTLLEKFAEYVRDSKDTHYLDDNLTEKLEDIEHWIETHKIDLEI